MRALLLLLCTFAAPCFAQTAEGYRQQAIEESRQKSWDQAIANYRKALELDPKDALTHYNLALALKYKGEAKQAVDEFEAALRLKPKWADAQYALGAAWYDLHDLPAAEKELQTAIRVAPANAEAHRLLARIYLEQSNPSSAKTELQPSDRIEALGRTLHGVGADRRTACQSSWCSGSLSPRPPVESAPYDGIHTSGRDAAPPRRSRWRLGGIPQSGGCRSW